VRIAVDERSLREGAVRWRQEVQARRHPRPHDVEALGRALRWFGDPDTTAYLRRAAEMELGSSEDTFPGTYMKLIHAGNLFRMAGDHGRAATCLERARALLEPRLPEEDFAFIRNYPRTLSALRACCFLLGLYTEVEALGELVRVSGGEADSLALLARARRTGDADAAARALKGLNRGARLHQYTPAIAPGTDMISAWDWYEMAMESPSPASSILEARSSCRR
jgi:hypothetical protein